MNLSWLFPTYIAWHYSRGTKNALELWKTFLWFTLRFFSVVTLFKTLFAPFQRLNAKSSSLIEFEKLMESIVANTIMRILGFVLRSILIILGIVSWVGVLILGLLALIVWFALPFLIGIIIVYVVLSFFS